MTKKRKNLGKLGENLAKKLLLNKGYKFIEQNFRSRFGEIDLIFQDEDTLVFVEVKTRYSDEYGIPEEAVTKYKIRSIARTGDYFKLLNPEYPESLRIDVVAIEINPSTLRLKAIRHLISVTS